MNFASILRDFVESLRKYWKVPPKDRYLSYKEITSLSVGGIGVKFIVYCISQMIIGVGNTLIGNTIGIDPTALYVIYIISILSSFPLTALRAKMIDNTRSMKGKYRPYIITMGIPTVILGVGFIWMPYENMSLFAKCAVVLAFNIGFQFFYNFYNDAYDSLINVLSPNSIERSDVLSIKSVIENFSPSIASIFLPIVAKLITGDDTLYDLRIYRVLFPPMIFLGFVISLLVYVNTEEKIVQAKTHIIQIKFSDAFRAVANNKYFWIISLAGWLGFLEGAFGSIMGWMYNYQHACTSAQYSLIVAIAGNASFWPNLIAPFFIRKYGKKKILIFTNILNIGFITLMLPIVRMTGSTSIIWLLLICTFVNQFITSLGHLLSPSVNADIRDYQQYITGERIDGMFATVGLLGNVITLVTSGVLPTLYEKAGLNKEVALSLGYDGLNVYDVLYNNEYFLQISSVLIIASIVGAILNVIPYFFYDLTETKQKAVVKVLKIRAMFEDYSKNAGATDDVKEAVDIIKECRLLSTKKANDLTEIKKASKSKREFNEKKRENENITIACFVMDELNKYSTPEGKAELEEARMLVANGPESFMSVELPSKKAIKAMPKNTQIQINRRRDALVRVQSIAAAKKTVKKHYPNGIESFDLSRFDELYADENDAQARLISISARIKQAKESNDSAGVHELNVELRLVKQEKAQIKREIKKANNEYSLYCRAAKPYLDAQRIISQAENYMQIDKIEAIFCN